MSRTDRISGIDEDGDPDEHRQQLVGVRAKSLEPITPDEVLERYLEDEDRKRRRTTVTLRRSRIRSLVDRCANRERDDSNDFEIELYDDLRLGVGYRISKSIPDDS